MSGYDPTRVFRKLAYNNALANLRLHDACARLPPGEFEAERVGFFPSLRATLNHIFTVDWFYIDALEGGALGCKAFDNEIPYPAAKQLAEAQARSDARLTAFCEALSVEKLAMMVEIRRSGRTQRERTDDVLSHLFQHQTHHRGQAHAMLSGTGVAPPQLDEFIVADDAGLRAAECAALGFTERKLMG